MCISICVYIYALLRRSFARSLSDQLGCMKKKIARDKSEAFVTVVKPRTDQKFFEIVGQ